MNREHAVFLARAAVLQSAHRTPQLRWSRSTQRWSCKAWMGNEPSLQRISLSVRRRTSRMTSLEAGEILTAVRVPAKWAGQRFYFEKVADRNVWDFALVSIAVAMSMDGDTIGESRFVCGGVACTPHRLRNVEMLHAASRCRTKVQMRWQRWPPPARARSTQINTSCR